MYDRIKNPVTNRFVKTDSTQGQQIINNYLTLFQSGGVNPHSKEKWSSYNCDYNSEDDCYDQGGINCKWVNKTDKKKGYCRKTQSSSRKRGHKNWKLLQNKLKTDTINKLTREEVEKLLYDYKEAIGGDEWKYSDIYGKLQNLEYEAGYKSAFTGNPIDKFNHSVKDVIWFQASDKLAAYFKYGDSF